MSPVSRGRKPKKQKKSRGGRKPQPFLADFTRPVGRPAWFDPALAAAVAETAMLAGVSGPRELEEATATLIGARLHAADGMGATRYGAWTEELVGVLAERVREGGPEWRGAWFCLHGLLSITPAEMSDWVGEVIEELRPALPDAGDGWLAAMSQIAPTGEAWRLVDAYGTRIGLAAEFRYPEPGEPMVYLLDFDISGFPRLESAGVHDDLDHAVTAWRNEVGPSAAGAEPRPIGDGADVAVLTYWDMGELFVTGFESRTVMDNWYRSQRRADDLIAALAKRGVDLPKHRSLVEELDIEPTVTAFTTWYIDHHQQAPAPEPTEALAAEWLETALPGTELAVSPRRVQTVLQLVGDWMDGDLADGVRALLPEWIRWNAAQVGLPPEFTEAALAAMADLN
ncbi:hypothetical protein [Dactylosporangium matsuzakiense]|uniref:Uncharacterized protein n=1 Tax=Dactylosporangium matsuzakiense TaxID=53360 RepID=A0A9W6KDK4_9ACTN|nr:hypothetical protein [Dactylosporangium matsuzakiense]UWZ45140.1 hypothetical protein Dmats_00820 [Dactylosporangium matsuzakiense]GLK98911.1 hypothetical protein GCM10017581_006520 [Dactylosporangium matsuzakiense]